jgi:hypothetical protein
MSQIGGGDDASWGPSKTFMNFIDTRFSDELDDIAGLSKGGNLTVLKFLI